MKFFRIIKGYVPNALIVLLCGPLVITAATAFFAGADVVYIFPEWFAIWSMIPIVLVVIVGTVQMIGKKPEEYADDVDPEDASEEEFIIEGMAGSDKSFTAKVDADGNLVFTLFDYSDRIHEIYGNDVASYLIVKAKHKVRFAARALEVPLIEMEKTYQDNVALKDIIEKFPTFYKLETWLKENNFPHEYDFDNWA